MPAFAQRISYVGELGWELYGQIEMGDAAVGAALGGRPRARSDRGAGSGRSTRCGWRRATGCWGQDIDTEHDPFEAGLGFAVRMDKDFQGSEALEAIRERGPPRGSCR